MSVNFEMPKRCLYLLLFFSFAAFPADINFGPAARRPSLIVTLKQHLHYEKLAGVQKRYYKEAMPTVHGWVYDLKNGRSKDLNFDMEAEITRISKIYDLHDD